MRSTNHFTVSKILRNPFVNCLTGLIFILLLTSCASFSGKITPIVSADIGYFADQTISMLSSAEISMGKDETVYTREYFDPADPDEQRLYELEHDVHAVLKTIIDYSLSLVTIADTHDTEAERVEAYANWFLDPSEVELNRINMGRDRYLKIVENIRSQKTLQDALKAAQPLLYALGIHMNKMLDEYEATANVVAKKIDAKIDAEYAEVIDYQEILEKEKYNVLGALKDTYRVFIGEEGAYEDLRKNKAIWNKKLVPPGTPNYDQTKSVADHLLSRLDSLHTVGREIEPDWQLYRETHRELDQLQERVTKEIKTYRVLTLIWIHAHYRMASGRAEPAEWFDTKDIGMAALKLIF